jgi:hypothetical protein
VSVIYLRDDQRREILNENVQRWRREPVRGGVIVQTMDEWLAGPPISSVEATPCPLLAGVLKEGSTNAWKVLGSGFALQTDHGYRASCVPASFNERS